MLGMLPAPIVSPCGEKVQPQMKGTSVGFPMHIIKVTSVPMAGGGGGGNISKKNKKIILKFILF
jgi:hypothetical protein